MAATTEAEDFRQWLADMADGLVVCGADGSPDPEATGEITAWLRHLADLGDEALDKALS